MKLLAFLDSIFLPNGQKQIGAPPAKDRYINFVRVWNGRVYSCKDSTFLYDYNDWIHLYKTQGGEYFNVSCSAYGDWDYTIMNKDEAIKWLCKMIDGNNIQFITNLLKTEFQYELQ